MREVTLLSHGRHGPAPRADAAIDCRVLANPHRQRALRPLDGRDPRVRDFVRQDARFQALLGEIHDAAAAGARVIALFCHGGRHRSVAMAELAAAQLRDDGFAVRIRHTALAA